MGENQFAFIDFRIEDQFRGKLASAQCSCVPVLNVQVSVICLPPCPENRDKGGRFVKMISKLLDLEICDSFGTYIYQTTRNPLWNAHLYGMVKKLYLISQMEVNAYFIAPGLIVESLKLSKVCRCKVIRTSEVSPARK